MHSLKVFMYNNNMYVDSRKVAPMIGLKHSDLLAGINHMVDILRNNNQNVSEKFVPRKEKGEIVYYRLSRSGCDMVAIQLTPDEEKRILFTNAYTDSFRHKEKVLRLHASEEWQRKRKLNVSGQLDFSDAIKELVTYAEQNDSKNANRYYTLYNKLLNDTVGIIDGERDEATANQLENLSKANIWAGKIIKQGIFNGDDYHDIYKKVKQSMMAFKEMLEMTMPELPMEVE